MSFMLSDGFLGHFSAGLFCVGWGSLWLHEAIQAADTDRTGRALEQTLTMPVVKILAVLIWIPGMPHSGWEPMHIVMGWLHLTGYVAIGLSGVVDISARHGKIGSRATYFALAGASLINALLFWYTEPLRTLRAPHVCF